MQRLHAISKLFLFIIFIISAEGTARVEMNAGVGCSLFNYELRITNYEFIDMAARGLRNNNPLNIRVGGQKWVGEIRPSSDRSFCTFETVEYGYRAALKLLRNYRLRYKCKTVRDIITRWAPPEDHNDTEKYIRTVCAKTGMHETHEVDIDSEDEMTRLTAAMCLMENGEYGDKAAIAQGWRLL